MTTRQPEKQADSRYALLDEIRGLNLASMILYHFLWDLVFIAGIEIPWYTGTAGHIWQQSICWTFIFLSGFCWSLGRHRLKRGLTVFLAGGLVTAVTLAVMPQNRVVFGVLTLLGSSMLLMIPLDRLFAGIKDRRALTGCLIASIALFILFLPINNGFIGAGTKLPGALYADWLSTYFGFPMRSFYSADYFALLPWFILFLGGYFCYRVLLSANEEQGAAFRPFTSFLRTSAVPLAAFAGRRSLLIYLLHQPVLYGITQLVLLSMGKL